MNGYERRQAMRDARHADKLRELAAQRRYVAELQAKAIGDAYREAYQALGLGRCAVAFNARSGWYNITTVNGLHKRRGSELQDATRGLWARHHEQELGGNDD